MKLIEDDGLGLWVTTSLLASSRHTHVDPVAYSQYERTILHLCNERAQSLPHFLVNSSSILMFHIQQREPSHEQSENQYITEMSRAVI